MKTAERKISYGDRIYTRVTRNGQTVLDFVTEKVSNMTELIGELRRAMRDLQGLVMLHIRNYHQGWGTERPLMLYAGRRVGLQEILNLNSPVQNTAKPAMLRPWEVH